MGDLLDSRRYLSDFDSVRTGNILTDVLIVGSGVAGARAALEAANSAQVALITKGRFDESATNWAQGGIAAAVARDDSPNLHFEDTMRVGCGLNDPVAVRTLVEQGPALIRELTDWGFAVDRNGDSEELALGREGGHSLNRVVHARGDQTGSELVETLKRRVAANPNIRIFEQCFLIDFLTADGLCVGAVTFHPQYGHQLIWARQTILASGGCGRLWRETTNPPVVTGDGLAAAFRAGAALRDIELMQFHPTTLYVAGAGRALISEAVRGEGGYLVDKQGRRFMREYHPDVELAPRDIVSRAIHQHLLETHANCVYLDVRHLSGFRERFPHIARLCQDFQIDIAKDLIPVRPSAHYLVGGVDVAADGTTSVPGLLCCGEASSSGVHGANRMASNSLLEGLVFGRIAGATAARRLAESPGPAQVLRSAHQTPPSQRTALDLSDIRNSLRSLMWRNVGIVRTGERLLETVDILNFWAHYTLDKTFDDPAGWELQNMLTAARLVALCALERRESIGVHFRGDATDNGGVTHPLYHTRISRSPSGARPQCVPV